MQPMLPPYGTTYGTVLPQPDGRGRILWIHDSLDDYSTTYVHDPSITVKNSDHNNDNTILLYVIIIIVLLSSRVQ
jgi:hypothetical protein